MIRHGYKDKSALDIADELLLLSQGMGNLASLDLKKITEIKGIQNVKGLQLLATFEISKRMMQEQSQHKDVISNPESVAKWLQLTIGNNKQEVLMVLYLNVRNEIIYHEIVFKGTIDRSLVHPREIFKQALLKNSTKIIVVHNHPSGSIEPSSDDICITERLIEVGELMNIDVLDHIIVSRDRTFSFKQAGLMD